MIGITDERLANLVAEHDRLGERVLGIDARLAAEARALAELAGTRPDRAEGLSTLAEISERDGVLGRPQCRVLGAKTRGKDGP